MLTDANATRTLLSQKLGGREGEGEGEERGGGGGRDAPRCACGGGAAQSETCGCAAMLRLGRSALTVESLPVASHGIHEKDRFAGWACTLRWDALGRSPRSLAVPELAMRMFNVGDSRQCALDPKAPPASQLTVHTVSASRMPSWTV